MKIKLSKKDILWSYVGTFLTMGANLIILPFLMHYLNDDTLGLWYVFASVGGIVTLFDFGFSVTFARNITYCWSGAKTLKKEEVDFIDSSEPDFRMMKKVLTSCKIIYGVLSGIALLLLVTLGTLYISSVSKDFLGKQHILAWIIYAIAIFMNLYYGYYSSFLRGLGAVDRANKNAVISKVIQIVLTVILLMFDTGLIGASVAYLAYGTVFRILGKKYFYSYHNIKEKLHLINDNISWSEVVEMLQIVWHNAWRDGVISISNYLCNQASTLICSMYLPLAQTGVYSIGVQIASAIAQVAGTLYNAYQPELQSSYISGQTEKVRNTLAIIVMSFIYIFVLGIIGTCFVGLPILKLIKPRAVVSVPVLLGLAVYQFILKYRNCYTSFFSSTNRIIYMNGFITSAFLCVVLSFVALKYFHLGVWGLIIAQIFSQAIYNLWKWPKLAHEEMQTNLIEITKLGTKEIIYLIKKLLRKRMI